MTTLAVERFATRAALDQALQERLRQALGAPGAAVMLAGGTTPLPAYRALARTAPAHQGDLRILFSDDRYVPSDDEASNYHQSRPLLDALELPPAAILRIRTELPLAEAASDYERALTALLQDRQMIGLGLLGLGADGHTASLFSAADLARATGRLAIAVQRPDGMAGVSVTPAVLARTGDLIFVVAGTGKERAVSALLAQDASLTAWRAVQDCPRVSLWLAQGA